jgi:Phosphoenolpyruvate-protein kinase (PTS system EI component in bacteria)
VFEFFVPSCIPNYITTKCASGLLAKGNLSGEVVEDRILLIEAADPGYDWIFSHHILGFITKYGGANSHMAIRAGELGVPAVIGVGDQLFSQLQNAKTVFIDCNNHKIDMIR